MCWGVNNDVGIGGNGIFGKTSTSRNDSVPVGVTVTISPQQIGVYPKTVTVDSGTGCYSHGYFRSGKIISVYAGRLIIPGNFSVTSFDQYKIDSIFIEGSYKITNTTVPVAGNAQCQFTLQVIDARLVNPSGNYTKWNSVSVKTEIEGNGTITPMHDVFSIAGLSDGKIKQGNTIYLWSSAITEPIIKKISCQWIVQGKVKLARTGLLLNSP